VAAAPAPAPAGAASRTRAGEEAGGAVRDAGSGGYARVVRDRRFLAFCVLSLLPLFCYGQIVSTYPVYLTQFLGVSLRSWGLLLSLNGVLIVAIQYPLIRRVRERSRLGGVALGSALLGIGVGAAAFASPGWSLWALMAVFSLGEMLFVPLSTSTVSGMTTVAERGRYMGVWSLVWIGGQALSPLATGWTMDALGGRPAMLIVLAAGLAGAGSLLVFARAERARA